MPKDEQTDNKVPRLKTDRLLLRRLKNTDAKNLFHYAKNPNVTRYTMWEAHKAIQDSTQFIESIALKAYEDGVPEPLEIEFLEDPGKIIGTVGCFWVSQSNDSMELAYAIGEKHWGKGIIKEASAKLLSYVFANFSVERIQCRCKAENEASLRVMEKLGFNKEGVLRNEVKHRGRYWDMIYTSILRSEWN
jgi:[ribosomal protein S5]-alanine N-acetyltransferase